MDRSSWARRAEITLRSNNPRITSTRIFETTDNCYVIVIDNLDQNADELDVDDIRPITLPLSLSNTVPNFFIREIPIIPDNELAQNYAGFPYTLIEVINLVSSRFPEVAISGMREQFTPSPTVIIEVLNSPSHEQEVPLIQFCEGLGGVAAFKIEVVQPYLVPSRSEPDLDSLEVRSSRSRPDLPDFVRKDEEFWFRNIDNLASGQLDLHQFPNIVEDQTRCFVDATIGQQLNLRQILVNFDTIYLSLPLASEHEKFLNDQSLSEADLLILVDAGRLKFISTQAEERLNKNFLAAAFEHSSSAFIGRRTTAAILLNDIAATSNEYWWFHPSNLDVTFEVCSVVGSALKVSADEIMQRLFWPVRVHRQAIRPLLARGSKGMLGIGIGQELAAQLKRDGKDVEILCAIMGERIHVAHALNATTFLGSNDDPNLAALGNVMGDCLNAFRSNNTRLAAAWIGNENRKKDPKRLLPPIPLFEFEKRLPITELLAVCDNIMLRNHGRSLLSRLADIPEADRQAEISRLSGELRKLGRPGKILNLDNADTFISALSLFIGFAYPPIAGLRALGRQITEKLASTPSLGRVLETVAVDLFGDHPEKRDLDFLAKMSRVAVLKSERIS